MKVIGDRGVGTGSVGGGPADPITAAIADLRMVDRAMARVLRVVADAEAVEGLPAWRLLSLATFGTSWDARFIRTCTEVLRAMPATWQAFDAGLISWGQIRGIVTAAQTLSITDRAVLDELLTGAVAQNGDAEPDRLVHVAGDLAGRLANARLADRETAQTRRSGVRLSPQLFGGIGISGYLDELWGSDVAAAIADATPDPRPGPATDADGHELPASWTEPDGLEHRQAIGLWRLAHAHLHADGARVGADAELADAELADAELADAELADAELADAELADAELADAELADAELADAELADAELADAGLEDAYHAGRTPDVVLIARRPGRMAAVIVDIAALTEDRDVTGVPAATARQLWATAAGRTPLSTARVSYLTCDALRTPVLTDGDRILAIADAYDPVPTAVRRAVVIRDQGCRFPGCDRPAADTDLHHIVFQRHGGQTAVWQCVLLCPFCHNLVHKDGWHLTLHDDGRLVVRRGRWRFSSRPRLRPPPPCRPLNRDGPPSVTVHRTEGGDHSRAEPHGGHLDVALPF